MKDFNGKDISIGDTVLFHPKGLASVSDHLAIATVTRLTEKTVFVSYECEYSSNGTKWGRIKQGMKEYPRRFDQVYVIKKGGVE